MKHRIISIGRQFGSGGHEIGREVSGRLGIPCYDKELIALAAEHGGLDHGRLAGFDERQENPWLYEAVYEGNHQVPKGCSYPEVLFKLQSDVIRSVARREDAVIIGRCADHILRDAAEVSLLRVFVAAPFEDRVRRKMEQETLTRRAAEALVRKTDRQRGQYYQAHTGREWGRRDGYDLFVDAAAQSREEILRTIQTAYAALPA